MEVNHSRRILIVGAPGSGVLQLVEDLTGTTPEPHEDGSTAGLTHEWDVQTQYYKAKVPIWIDEIADIEAWKAEFLRPEAKEVVEAVGACVFCFRQTQNEKFDSGTEETMKAIQDVMEGHVGYGHDAVMLAVAVPRSKTLGPNPDQVELEDVASQYGYEYIEYSAQGQNEFGEKVGFERVKEALEANEWAASNPSDEEDLNFDDLDFDNEDGVSGFARDEAEMTAELFGVKAALSGDGSFVPDADDFVPPGEQEMKVENLDRMMGKLLAIKEQGADLPQAQRKRMAAKAVRELLKEDGSL